MTVWYMDLNGDSQTGYTATEPSRISKKRAFDIRDQCRRIRFDWEKRVIDGKTIVDKTGDLLNKMQHSTLYKKPDGSYMFFQRF